MPSPQEAARLIELVDDLVHEAKAVRRRSTLVVQLGARLKEQLLNQLETQEVTSEHEHPDSSTQ